MDMLLIKFDMERFSGVILKPSDLDGKKITFKPHIRHVTCLPPSFFVRMIIGSEWDNTVYFHPNVDVNGWVELQGIFQDMRKRYEVGETDGLDLLFPGFPSEPKFWDEGVSGSELFLWPPRFFLDWVTLVAECKALSLNPSFVWKNPQQSAPPTPGPSHLRPPSSPPSIRSTPSNTSITQHSTSLQPASSLTSPPAGTPPMSPNPNDKSKDLFEEFGEFTTGELNDLATVEKTLTTG